MNHIELQTLESYPQVTQHDGSLNFDTSPQGQKSQTNCIQHENFQTFEGLASYFGCIIITMDEWVQEAY